MKRILVPTDFSPAADQALDYAMQLAARSGAEVIALHTVSLPLPDYAVQPEGMKEYNQYRVDEARLQLEAYRERYEGTTNLTTVLVNGEMTDVVPEKAVQYDADMVVMGTRGADGLRTVLGTHAAAVLGHCLVPVLVIPECYKGGLPQRIVLAVQHEENEFLLAPVFQLQALCGAELITLHFTEEGVPKARRAQLAGELEALRTKWGYDFGAVPMASEVITGKDFHASLNGFVQDQDINLVTMVTHRAGSLQGRFRKSLTREQAFHTRVPLLSLHV